MSRYVILILLVLAACRETPVAPETPPARKSAVEVSVERWRDSMQRLHDAEYGPLPDDERPTRDEPDHVEQWDTLAGFLQPELKENLPKVFHTAKVRLPERSDGFFQVIDKDTGMSMQARLEGVGAVQAQTHGSFAVWPDAFDGGDLVHHVTQEGTEDAFMLATRPPDGVVAWELVLGDTVAGLRVVEGVVELIGEDGSPRLRVGPAKLLDAKDQILTPKLDVTGCEVDRDPSAPWGRRPVPPKARACRVAMVVPGEAEYPVFVDPGWETTASPARFHYRAEAAEISPGMVLVSGHQSTNYSSQLTADIFSLSSKTWSVTGSMARARYAHALTQLPDGTLLASGGAYLSGGTEFYQKSAEIYQPASGKFENTTLLSHGHYFHSAVRLLTGQVLIAGGDGSDHTWEIYDPSNYTWVGGPTGASGDYQEMTLLGDGTALLVYGSRARVFDPATRVWTATGSLSNSRSRHELEPIEGGAIAFGGRSSAIAERYSIASGTWTPVTPAPFNLEYVLSTTLPSNDILVVGTASRYSGLLHTLGTAFTSTGRPQYSHIDGSLTAFSNSTHTVLLFGSGNSNTSELWDGLNCSATSNCGSGRTCVDGYCCNTACDGACDRCDLPGVEGTCTVTTAGATSEAPSCNPYLCDGTSAGCPAFCTTASDCASTHYCDGGACVPRWPNGSACSSDDICSSDFCADGVCCNGACDGGCDVCNQAGLIGTCTRVAGTGSPSCTPYLCEGTTNACPATCSDDSQCARGNYCEANECVPLKADADACSANSQCQSGSCADGVCCDTACEDGCESCNLPGTTGVCSPEADGRIIASCNPYRCDGTSPSCPTTCVSAADCLMGYACEGGACVPSLTNGSPCNADGPCISGQCTDNVCCDTECGGACERCNVAGSSGTCTAEPDAFAAASCAPYLCDGTTGSCPTTCAEDEDCAATHWCDSGVCSLKKGSGTECGANGECTSGACNVRCCSSSCDGPCNYCNTSGSCRIEASNIESSCSPYLCSGTSGACRDACTVDSHCAAGNYCLAGECVTKLTLGTACSASNQCDSTRCVDGVCCNSTCSGNCNACNISGSEGTCALQDAGTPGFCGGYTCDGVSANCPSSCTSDGQCADTHYCTNGLCLDKRSNGQGCTTDVMCESDRCVDGVCCDMDCQGGCASCRLPASFGQCVVLEAGESGTCGTYACDGASPECPTSCSTDAQCGAGYGCVDSECVAATPLGGACTTTAQCTNGQCVDGVCCDSACDGACEQCNAPGSAGTCSPVADETTSASCTPYLCDGASGDCPTTCSIDDDCASTHWCDAGACVAKKTSGAVCEANGQCASDVCDGRCCTSSCDGPCNDCSSSGQCVNSSSTREGVCGLYRCSGTSGACRTTCSVDSQCASDAYCLSGECVTKKPLGEVCVAGRECASDECVEGACCDTACEGACDTCQRSGAVGTCSPTLDGSTPQSSCGGYLCNGVGASCPNVCSGDADCSSTYFCDQNRCVPRQAPGASCDAANECASGFCTDGVCCNRACDGSCEACSASGSCQFVSDAPAECSPYLCVGETANCPGFCNADSDCTSTHWCDSGVCSPKSPLGTACAIDDECFSGECVDSVCCNGACEGDCNACDIEGSVGECSVQDVDTAGFCGIYTCDGSNVDCPTSCSSDAQCAESHYCAGNRCLPKRPNGQGCGTDNSCDSGHCEAGLCCDAECEGACTSCRLPDTYGQCTPLAAGTAGTCGTFACDGASPECPATCSSDAQCIAGYGCVGGACVAATPNGGACSTDGQCTSGQCVDGVCCNAACDGGCDKCDVPGLVGTCTVITGGSADPSCSPYLCTGQGASCPTTCDDGSDCDASAFCSDAGACEGTKDNGATCQNNAECGSRQCVDGVCCDRACDGACESCALAGDEGTCGNVAAGMPSDDAACPFICRGNATCPASCSADSDCRDEDTWCSEGQCVPRSPTGASCQQPRECLSKSCVDGVCCNSECSGSCDRCDLEGTVGECSPAAISDPGAPACGAYACNGTDASCPTTCENDSTCGAGYFCSAGVLCLPSKPLGASCETTRECASGHCVDGVCCNSGCTGQCESCSASGGGLCTPVSGQPVGARPACEGSGSCQGVCDGVSSSCRYPTTATSCEAATCDGDVLVAQAFCNGTGDCAVPEAVSCAPYGCRADTGTCRTLCAGHSDCASGSRCDQGVCVGARVDGETCGADGECVSSQCSDGVCCDSACAGGCERCDLPSSPGVCLASVEEGACSGLRCLDGQGSCPEVCTADAECEDGRRCVLGACLPKLGNGARCDEATACASGACVDGVCCESACDSDCAACAEPGQEGRCVAVTGQPRGDRPTCASDGVCSGFCDGLSLDCKYPGADTACGPGFCSDNTQVQPGVCDGQGVCARAEALTCEYGCRDGECVVPASGVGCTAAGSPAWRALALLMLFGLRRRKAPAAR